MLDKYKKETIQVYGTILFIIFLIIFIVTSMHSYVDITNFCIIRIKENVLNHEKSDIKSALHKLKNTNTVKYKTVCKYVDTINMKRCLPGDSRVDTEYKQIQEKIDGCYVRGTHTIYLKPNNRQTTFTIDERVNQIEKYSSFSKDFWKYK